MEHNNKEQRQRLRDAYMKLGLQMQPTAFVTLTTNDTVKTDARKKKDQGPPKALTWRHQGEPKVSEISKTLDMTRLIGEYLAMMDRALLGRNWSQVSPDQRTDGLFIIEHTKTNIHAHGLLRFPAAKTRDLEVLTLMKWNRLTQSGDTNFQSICDVDRVAEYCMKEMANVQFSSDQVVLTRQFMAA
ncbi:hypothetical protein [Shinella sedimenti]|uniref:Uncharacterized protein n=1 Tax=Shinella sedimenti TaxID=2919913 RepID=A0ABT0CTB9_9HYPH|nr:hypothetical protein [Shinella sedimenti]MCJ8151861.1 hypothetical protein [Shinella sedimenti]